MPGYTGSGVISISGTVLLVVGFNEAASGAIQSAGSAGFIPGFLEAASGTSSTTGAAAYTFGYTEQVSGGISAAGSSGQVFSFLESAGGIVQSSGTASLITGQIFTGSGSTVTSGNAATSASYVFAPTGAILTSGFSPEVLGVVIAGSGTILTSGAAQVSSGSQFSFNGSGAAAISGGAQITWDLFLSASGTLHSSGASTSLLVGFIPQASGGSSLSGQGSPSLGFVFGTGGQLVLSGSAGTQFIFAIFKPLLSRGVAPGGAFAEAVTATQTSTGESSTWKSGKALPPGKPSSTGNFWSK
jgi:hypothetical protein